MNAVRLSYAATRRMAMTPPCPSASEGIIGQRPAVRDNSQHAMGKVVNWQGELITFPDPRSDSVGREDTRISSLYPPASCPLESMKRLFSRAAQTP